MIKVIIERQAKEAEHLLSLLREIRAAAMKQPGYISGETLVSTEDNSSFVVISTWQSLKDWKAWDKSEGRARLEKRIEQLLVKAPEVRVYRYLSYPKTAGQD